MSQAEPADLIDEEVRTGETTRGTLLRPSLLARPWGVPTGRLILLASIPTVLSLGMLWEPSTIIPVLAIDVWLVLIAVVDMLRARGSVAVWRTFAPVQAVGRDFPVTLGVRNVGRRALSVRLTDGAPGPVKAGLPAQVRLEPGAESEHSYRLEVDRRGQHPFGPVVVRWRSPVWPVGTAAAVRCAGGGSRVSRLWTPPRCVEPRPAFRGAGSCPVA